MINDLVTFFFFLLVSSQGEAKGKDWNYISLLSIVKENRLKLTPSSETSQSEPEHLVIPSSGSRGVSSVLA